MRTIADAKYDVKVFPSTTSWRRPTWRSARLIRDDPIARTIADGKISSWEYASILLIPLMHLTPNPCCQTEMGQLPHRARSTRATNSDVEIFLDDFVAPDQAALGAPRLSLRLKSGRRTTGAMDRQRGAAVAAPMVQGSLRELHGSTHCRRHDLELGVYVDFINPLRASDAPPPFLVADIGRPGAPWILVLDPGLAATPRASLLLRRMQRPPTRSMTSKFSLDNFVAATHVTLCTPDSRRPHRSNHCRRQNLEPGVCINFIDPPDASDAQSLLPNRDGPVASSCAIDQSHEFKCRDLPRRFRGSCPGSAWRA